MIVCGWPEKTFLSLFVRSFLPTCLSPSLSVCVRHLHIFNSTISRCVSLFSMSLLVQHPPAHSFARITSISPALEVPPLSHDRSSLSFASYQSLLVCFDTAVLNQICRNGKTKMAVSDSNLQSSPSTFAAFSWFHLVAIYSDTASNRQLNLPSPCAKHLANDNRKIMVNKNNCSRSNWSRNSTFCLRVWLSFTFLTSFLSFFLRSKKIFAFVASSTNQKTSDRKFQNQNSLDLKLDRNENIL